MRRRPLVIGTVLILRITALLLALQAVPAFPTWGPANNSKLRQTASAPKAA